MTTLGSFGSPRPASFSNAGQLGGHEAPRWAKGRFGSGSDFLPLIRLAVKAGTRRKRTESGRWLKTTHADASANRGDEHAQ
jgi:hypothetical protein